MSFGTNALLFGTDMFGDAVKTADGLLCDKYTEPPFSVLDCNSGRWRDRKRAWLSLGITSEVGRNAVAFHTAANIAKGRTGISVFDPVLCECCYSWFSNPGDHVVDPFAGGSVRGIIAGAMGRKYTGIELREEQVRANRENLAVVQGVNTEPVWVIGDCLDSLYKLDNQADLVFTCPPYADLEVYSDDPRDLSTMEYHTFNAAMARVLVGCMHAMRPGAFACFVIGDARNKKTGAYRGIPWDLAHNARVVGLELYNQAILRRPIGTLAQRVGKQMEASRKLGTNHEHILVFRKPK